MDFTVVICTYNRSSDLADTLLHLARVTTSRRWEVIVVDNNSIDDTRAVLNHAVRAYPVPLRILFEATPGKYGALNTAIRAAQGAIIAATDDDARVAPDWLDRAEEGLLAHGCDFVGGPVRPLWEGPPPDWLDAESAVFQKVIATCDYGRAPREYGAGIGWPLGVNVAYRREAFERAGLFDAALGRKAGTLRSQSQREWHLRARAAGMHGFYVPGMAVEHRVSVDRLNKRYFRRWCYWQGISRANMYWRFGFDPEEPEANRHGAPLPSIAGVPRRFFPKALRSCRSWFWRTVSGERARAFEYELWLSFAAGFAKEARRLRTAPFAGDAAAGSLMTASRVTPLEAAAGVMDLGRVPILPNQAGSGLRGE